MGTFAGQRQRPSSASAWIKFALLGVVISIFFQGALCEKEPTESECRPYIEKALKEQHLELEEKNLDESLTENILSNQEDNPPTDELTDSIEDSSPKDAQSDDGKDDDDDDNDEDDGEVQKEDDDGDDDEGDAKTEEQEVDEDKDESDDKPNEQDEDDGKDEEESMEGDGVEVESKEESDTKEDDHEDDAKEVDDKDDDDKDEKDEIDEKEKDKDDDDDEEDDKEKSMDGKEDDDDEDDDDEDKEMLQRPIEIETHEVELDDDDDDDNKDDVEEDKKYEEEEQKEDSDDDDDDDDKKEDDEKDEKDDEDDDKKGEEEDEEAEGEELRAEKADDDDEKIKEDDKDDEDDGDKDDDKTDEKQEDDEDGKDDEKETEVEEAVEKEKGDKDKDDDEDDDKTESPEEEEVTEGRIVKKKVEETEGKKPAESEEAEGSKEDDDQETSPEEEELIKEVVIPENLRPREHINKILRLDDVELETTLEKTIDATLKTLKGLYDNAIKPLEMLYKYRDLSNRHFGDPEIFSKPLILFMGPWSGGKSSTINYLLDNEYSHTSLRTGAEPSPAYFNILMYGENEEILDGTQLAADWTFSGLQKFGQGLLDRLRGIKLPNKLLEKVNIVEIPGILEIRKQVQRLFPFNDACQWFIDRADIIFLVYDPSKLDVGPETEAILDQLKGREYQTRIILNKADQIKPEELMRVQGTLIWNISPLMSSSEPPIMYSTSLWSLPYEAGAPIRLLQAQERAFLRDLREAIDKRVENKIASARRFAVRVRNHAKMVDCYLTTYYNHKSFFGNRKKISDDIIEYPQKYHIYEGLSTLTNISRYDLPDPDVYRDFFKINPLYDFKKLSETCTYFRGCPINQLDVAIAYDLPELVGKYKKGVESAKEQIPKENS